jgi:hypothetical protein
MFLTTPPVRSALVSLTHPQWWWEHTDEFDKRTGLL